MLAGGTFKTRKHMCCCFPLALTALYWSAMRKATSVSSSASAKPVADDSPSCRRIRDGDGNFVQLIRVRTPSCCGLFGGQRVVARCCHLQRQQREVQVRVRTRKQF
ncbi:hypothetical protein Zmor_014857 [Zophobas morio]|uniref:Secreted protein n=1 Tax=Zophobas morio TaxID=2755281 RepID=A0AA38IIB4_9CUCU|nr:hypothetical protein Zmor_014857 [Zophobas morio]